MAKEICISSTPHETRLAILEDDLLTEIYYERENEYTLAGSIYKGRVTRVLPGMQSAFVDLGLERDAFLYVTDFWRSRKTLPTSSAFRRTAQERARDQQPRSQGRRATARRPRAATQHRPQKASLRRGGTAPPAMLLEARRRQSSAGRRVRAAVPAAGVAAAAAARGFARRRAGQQAAGRSDRRTGTGRTRTEFRLRPPAEPSRLPRKRHPRGGTPAAGRDGLVAGRVAFEVRSARALAGGRSQQTATQQAVAQAAHGAIPMSSSPSLDADRDVRCMERRRSVPGESISRYRGADRLSAGSSVAACRLRSLHRSRRDAAVVGTASFIEDWNLRVSEAVDWRGITELTLHEAGRAREVDAEADGCRSRPSRMRHRKRSGVLADEPLRSSSRV